MRSSFQLKDMAITKTLNWEQVGIYLESSSKRKEFGVTEVGRQGKGERRGMGGGSHKGPQRPQ